MLKKPLFLETFFVFAAVGILNYVASTYDLYWSITELDSVAHFLGGATLSLFFLWLYFFSGFFAPADRSLSKFLLVSILGMAFIAVSWEIYELLVGEVFVLKDNYSFDTALDFIMDFLGAVAACLYGFLKEIKNKNES